MYSITGKNFKELNVIEQEAIRKHFVVEHSDLIIACKAVEFEGIQQQKHLLFMIVMTKFLAKLDQLAFLSQMFLSYVNF